MPRLMVALLLLGLGWSACLIGGSAMLVESVPAHIRVPLQGGVDASMNFGAAALGALAGPVLALGGFFAVNVMAAVVLAALVGAGIRAAVRRSAGAAGRIGTGAVRED
jgi:MFS family permease